MLTSQNHENTTFQISTKALVSLGFHLNIMEIV